MGRGHISHYSYNKVPALKHRRYFDAYHPHSMLSISLLRPSNALISLFGLFVGVKLIQFVVNQVRSSRLPRLKGPPNNNFIFGRLREVFDSKDRAPIYESWSEQYGAVFQMPGMIGGRRLILCDPKAIVHVHSRDTFTYQGLPFSKKFQKKFVSFGTSLVVV